MAKNLHPPVALLSLLAITGCNSSNFQFAEVKQSQLDGNAGVPGDGGSDDPVVVNPPPVVEPPVNPPPPSVSYTQRTDNFSIQSEPKMDAIFVVDNSASMDPYQQKVSQSMAQFISQFSAIDADVHYGVLTTMSYKQAGSPVSQYNPLNLSSPFRRFMEHQTVSRGSLLSRFAGDRWLSQDTPGLVEKFGGVASGTSYSGGNINVGTFSNSAGVLAGEERADDSLLAALEDANVGVNGVNHGFLRPDAKLAVVFVTDEDHSCTGDRSCSDSQIAALSTALRSRLDTLVQSGMTAGYRLAFVINSSQPKPANRNATGVLPYPWTYLQEAADFNAPILDIKSNFSQGLVQIGADLAVDAQLSFQLAYQPVLDANHNIEVKVGNQVLADQDWDYDASTNSVKITESVYNGNRGAGLVINYEILGSVASN